MQVPRYRINGFILSVNLDNAVKDDESIEFTFQEKKALKTFLASEDGFVETKVIESAVWPDTIVTSNSIRRLLSSLRAKFKSTDAVKNIRGKGYQLCFEKTLVESKKRPKKRFIKPLSFVIALSLIVIAITLVQYFSSNYIPNKIPRVSTQTVFESSDYILDYSLYDENLYVTASNRNSSTIYKVINRQKTVLMSEDFPGAYRGLEINLHGRTILHAIEDGKCKIKVFAKPIENLIDEIPCSRQNAFPSFDWIDNSRFYITLTVNPNTPVKPYTYDLSTKHLEEVTSINFNRTEEKFFIDSFIKARGPGIFSLRENHLEQMSLLYFEGKERRLIYQFRGKPYSIGVSDDMLYFVGNQNQLYEIYLEDNVLSQTIEPSMLLHPQTSKIDDIQVLQKNLYFSLGNSAKEIINSVSGDFTFSLENGIKNLSYVDGVLTILAMTNTGYVIEQLKNGRIIKSEYIDTPLNLTHIAFHKNQIYVAGASGTFVLVDNTLNQITTIPTDRLVANNTCLMIEANASIYLLNQTKLDKIVTQGERAFAGKTSCFYIDKLSGYIYDEHQKRITKPKKNKLMFEHQGKIMFWKSEGDQTHIFDNETEEVIATTKHRILNKRVISFGNDILYLGHADVNSSIVKLNLSGTSWL